MQYLLLRFCALGSLVGGGAFVVARDLVTAHDFSPVVVLKAVLGLPLMAVLSSFLAIPVGVVPASVASLLYWFVLYRFTSHNPSALSRTSLGMVIGGFVCGIFGALFFAVGAAPGSYPASVNVFAWVAAGVAGGAAGALSARRGTYEVLFKQRRLRHGA